MNTMDFLTTFFFVAVGVVCLTGFVVFAQHGQFDIGLLLGGLFAFLAAFFFVSFSFLLKENEKLKEELKEKELKLAQHGA